TASTTTSLRLSRQVSTRCASVAARTRTSNRRTESSRSAPWTSSRRRSILSEYRVGTGFDAHAFSDGVPLVLGGVEIDHPHGLAGHSDGDVVAHALIDAVLGAAGLGDIGSLFPSGEERFRGASSLTLLTEAYGQVRAACWRRV